MKNFSLSLCMILSFLVSGLSQYQIDLIPRVSPDKGVLSKVGYTDIIIEYGSPAVRDRMIWGDLIPYGKVWRAGANNATTIEFSQDVVINGEALSAGKYALFMIPKMGEKWHLIFNKRDDQWGAFSYNSEDDVLVTKAPIKKIEFIENLKYTIENVDFNQAIVSMSWEQVQLSFTVNTEYLRILENEVETQVADANADVKWVVYLQGAEYLLQQDSNLNKALEWVSKSEKLSQGNFVWDEQYYPKEYVQGHLFWTKAKILAGTKDYKNAIKYAEKCKNISGDYTFYDVDAEAENMEGLVAQWKNL